MRVSDLETSLPLVDLHTPALDAARMIAGKRLPVLVVADAAGRPSSLISAIDVLALLIPSYLRDDRFLSGVLDELGSDEVWAEAGERTIGELIEDDGVDVHDIVTVEPDATLVEVATLLAEERASVALVVHDDGPARFVTLPTVMEAILRLAGARPDDPVA